MAENSGGVHCLKYGLTTNNLLGVEMVLMDGEVLRLGGKQFDAEGYDLLGVVTGSEGLLGVVTEVTVRILPKPATVRALLLGFPDNASAGACVGAIIAAGIIPAGLEMMDKPAIEAAEAFCQPGYPMDVAAILICELDGPEVEGRRARRPGGRARAQVGRDDDPHQQERGGARALLARPQDRLRRRRPHGARLLRHGRHHPACPPARGPDPDRASSRANTTCPSPTSSTPATATCTRSSCTIPPSPARCSVPRRWSAEILKLCVEVGGVLTGEHGVGVEKRDLMGTMFSEDDLKQQQRIKCAFDPAQLLNPGKVFPTLHRCAELGQMHVHRGETPFPDLPRF